MHGVHATCVTRFTTAPRQDFLSLPVSLGDGGPIDTIQFIPKGDRGRERKGEIRLL